MFRIYIPSADKKHLIFYDTLLMKWMLTNCMRRVIFVFTGLTQMERFTCTCGTVPLTNTNLPDHELVEFIKTKPLPFRQNGGGGSVDAIIELVNYKNEIGKFLAYC